MTLEQLEDIAIACRVLGLATVLVGLAWLSDQHDKRKAQKQKLPLALARSGSIWRVL